MSELAMLVLFMALGISCLAVNRPGFALLIVLLGVVALTSGCTSNNWTERDTRREIAFQLINAADAYQTSRIQHRPDLVEGSPITRSLIGSNPSDSDTAKYFASMAISHYLISLALPAKVRPWFQNFTIAYHGGTVINNCVEHNLC